ncbi:MAG: ribose-phosphate pyrophosphokinase [Firmicutes bacterium]|nr:ribose-phosphate pyrophosphokinase [Bacillota bacterium]
MGSNGAFAGYKIFAGNGNPALAQEISEILDKPLGKSKSTKFADGEVFVSLGESVRGMDCYIIQPTCRPVNDNLMDLCIMVDAMHRASAGRINAIIPYFGYARQDRISKPREPLTAKLVADMISVSGVDRIITMDLHAAQIQGYFNIPVDNLYGMPILADYFLQKKIEDIVIVSPDHGSVGRARKFAENFDAPIAIIDKRRPKANVSEVMNIIGDIEGKNCIMIDDMVDTAGTICNAANALMANGAKSVHAAATHGVLSGPAIERIHNSAMTEMVLLNTMPIAAEKREEEKIKVLSVAPLLAEAIVRTHTNRPITSLYDKTVD